ncbi:TlpA family protein disulfide reductase [Dyella sp. LX-66]|uniref:TlpA family protein disulfide reductase n=1 Tax=unclassified Dyella TaxID=2634549 RepID=UPI001BE09122|nr:MULTISPECIES: TlpA disulfide reductase family protein [unclassified Dyella]MBT2116328.1 TlpA family protein disulfide reductase [Dyella sp. LX-1]MBT2140729.1 TlpA family protein disulfide reductase [Dyella sp. LX-66]
MHRLLLCCFLLLGLATAPAWAQSGQQRAEAAGKSLVGQPAPRVTVKTIDGKTIDLASLYGKQAVYLKFWATWCVPCREQMPHLKKTYEEAGPDLAVIAISVGFDETIEDVRKYRDEMGLKMPLVFDDGSLGEAFHLRVTPQHVVIGRDGRILYVGHEANAKLDAALQAARSSTGVAAAGAAAPKQEAHYDTGDRVPAFDAAMLDGKHLTLPEAGKPTALVFLSPWCESYLATSRPELSKSCRAMREQVSALSAHDTKLRWVGVASGLWAAHDELVKYRDEHRIGMPLTLDDSGALFRRFRVTHVPTVLLFDAQGRMTARVEQAGAPLDQALKTLTAR